MYFFVVWWWISHHNFLLYSNKYSNNKGKPPLLCIKFTMFQGLLKINNIIMLMVLIMMLFVLIKSNVFDWNRVNCIYCIYNLMVFTYSWKICCNKIKKFFNKYVLVLCMIWCTYFLSFGFFNNIINMLLFTRLFDEWGSRLSRLRCRHHTSVMCKVPGSNPVPTCYFLSWPMTLCSISSFSLALLAIDSPMTTDRIKTIL